jgi:hypothetical protein
LSTQSTQWLQKLQSMAQDTHANLSNDQVFEMVFNNTLTSQSKKTLNCWSVGALKQKYANYYQAQVLQRMQQYGAASKNATPQS